MREPQDTRLDAELVQGPPSGGPEAEAMEARLAEKLFGEPSGGTFIGRFRVVDRIGAGGMGVVYLAHDPKLGRDVAIKLLHAGSMQREVDRARLLREGHALAKLSHPNVVHLYDVDEHAGSMFLAMEHVAGVSLKEWQKDEHPWQDVLAVYLQAGEGLAAAHDAGLVHRDFKPANVLVSPAPHGGRSPGRVRVLDFGLAREPGMPGEGGSGSLSPAASSLPNGNLTHTGAVLGTPAYMSPEQVRGEPIDARADQFSFCVALWEALYGARPFGDGVPAFDDATAKAPVRVVLPRRAQRALERGLSPRPAHRFGHMRALLRELSPRTSARSRITLAFAGGLGLAAAASAMAMGGTQTQCDGVADVSAVWSDARKDALHEGLSAVPSGWDASATIDAALGDLDAYAQGWALARGDLCREQPTLAAAQHEARRACLERRRQQLADTVEILQAADGEVLIAAPQLVHAMAPIDACADAAVPASTPDPEANAWLAAIDRAVLLEAAGRIADAKAALDEVVVAMGDAEAPRVRGEVAMLRAKIAWGEEDLAASDTHLFDAATHAQRSGDDELAARAWIELALRATAYSTGDATAAARWLALGEAALSTIDEASRLSADALAARGGLAKIRGEHEDAVELYRQSVQRHREGGSAVLEVVHAMNRLGNAQVAAGKLEDAEDTYREALTLARETLGAEHPEIGSLHWNLGSAARRRGDRPAMLEHLRASLTILERAYGPESIRISGVVVRLGEARLQDGDFDEAIAYGRRAAAIQESLPPEDPESGSGLIIVALAHIAADRIAEARATLEELLPRLRGELHASRRLEVMQNLGYLSMRLEDYVAARDWYERLQREAEPGTEKAMRARAGLGECEIRLGELDAGIAKLETLRSAGQLGDGDSPWVAKWHLALGYAKKGERARARELADEVEADESEGPWKALALDELDEQLRRSR